MRVKDTPKSEASDNRYYCEYPSDGEVMLDRNMYSKHGKDKSLRGGVDPKPYGDIGPGFNKAHLS